MMTVVELVGIFFSAVFTHEAEEVGLIVLNSYAAVWQNFVCFVFHVQFCFCSNELNHAG